MKLKNELSYENNYSYSMKHLTYRLFFFVFIDPIRELMHPLTDLIFHLARCPATFLISPEEEPV